MLAWEVFLWSLVGGVKEWVEKLGCGCRCER